MTITIYALSLYQFRAAEKGDLSFEPNVLIKLDTNQGEWWTGTDPEGYFGQFPAACKKKAFSLADLFSRFIKKQSQNYLLRLQFIFIHSSFVFFFSKSKDVKQVEIVDRAKVLYELEPQEVGHLRLYRTDELVLVLQKIDTSWWQGALGGRVGM